jgi:hypothetical protein
MSWQNALRDPFRSSGAHIPDTSTNVSGLVKSEIHTVFTPRNVGAAVSNTHTAGFILSPAPFSLITPLAGTAADVTKVSDVNATGTGWIYGTPEPIPNLGAFAKNMARYRCVAMGVTIIYQGTELNRAGRFVAGLAPVQHGASSVAVSGTVLSKLSTIGDAGPVQDYTTVRNSLNDYAVSKVGDTEFNVCWKPNGVPTYQGQNTDGTETQMLPSVTVAGARVIESLHAGPAGDPCVAYGSNLLVVLIENDYVGTASTTGNQYTVDITVHWEVIPDTKYGVAYPLSPSLSNPQALTAALNDCSSWNTVAFKARPQTTKTQKRRMAPSNRRQPTDVISGAARTVPMPRVQSAPISKKRFAAEIAGVVTNMMGTGAVAAIKAAQGRPRA